MGDRGFEEAAERYATVRGTAPRDQLERTDIAQSDFEEQMALFDDEPLACGVENPESCDSCQ